MAKDKGFEDRMAGMMYAQQIVKEEGIEGLEKEIRRRGLTKIPLTTKKSELQHIWNELCQNMYNSITICFLWSLREEYGFAKKRLNRLMDRYQKTVADVMDVDYMGQRYIRLEDYAIDMVKQFGFDLDINRIATCQSTYDETGATSQWHTAKIEGIIDSLRRHGYDDAAEFLEGRLD